MSDLAEQLMLTHHAAVQMVNRLAKAGLAERRASDAIDAWCCSASRKPAKS